MTDYNKLLLSMIHEAEKLANTGLSFKILFDRVHITDPDPSNMNMARAFIYINGLVRIDVVYGFVGAYQFTTEVHNPKCIEKIADHLKTLSF